MTIDTVERPAYFGGSQYGRIVTIRLRRCIQPHADSTWQVRRGSFSQWNGYVLELTTTDGVTGFGYIDALIEFSDGWDVHRAALSTLAPVVLGRDPFEIESILFDLDSRLQHHRFVKAAIDTALHEIVATILGQPLFNLFGGAVRREIPATQIIPLKTPDAMADDARTRIDNGFAYIKIKLSGDVHADVERVRATRTRLGPMARLSVDANQGYAAPKDAIKALRQMEAFDVDFAEQPIHESDKKGLRQIRECTSIKIEADESAKSLADVYDLIAMGAVDTFNLRINELGGFRNAQAAMRLCEVAKVGYRFSSYGPQITAAHVAHLAASSRRMHAACDVAEYQQLLNDPFTGLSIVGGNLQVPTSAGSGIAYTGEAAVDLEICA